jgi:hypothetical protein
MKLRIKKATTEIQDKPAVAGIRIRKGDTKLVSRGGFIRNPPDSCPHPYDNLYQDGYRWADLGTCNYTCSHAEDCIVFLRWKKERPVAEECKEFWRDHPEKMPTE